MDTGADVNCIPIKLIKKLNIELTKQNKDYPVFDYNNNKVKIFGTVRLKCTDLDLKSEKLAEFLVVNDKSEPILGLEACIGFGLIKRLDEVDQSNADVSSVACLESKEIFLSKYGDIFRGVGKFPKKFSIQLKEDSTPVLHYKKRIPHTLLPKFKAAIEQMTRDEIISSVDYPTDWVNNVQIVEKPNGKLRICLDPKPLNECIKREHFLIPTIDDLTADMANKRVFSVFDLNSGFWHMELDANSSDLTTFMTPFGRFKFNRIPFGINCAPEMFQKEMIKIFGDIPGVIIYFDDLCVCAENDEEHDRIVNIVMERARTNNVKFNEEKIQYKKGAVLFMGHVLSNGSIKAQSKYREAVVNMKKPTNKTDVLRFLGLLKYLSKFIPNLSHDTAELRNLTRNDVEFVWTEKHEKEFSDLLNVITSEPVLAIYDPKQPVIVQTDASKDGLGCVIVQNGHPVAYASRTLAGREQKWAQIEKELLAIVFACEKFHFMLYGREFTVESDHKPLEALVKRDINDVTMRLQSMFMFLLKYPRMNIVYKPGKQMLVADCLSRAQLSEISEIEELSNVIHSVTKSVCLSEENYNFYRNMLKNDVEYSRICNYVENGWPGYHHLNKLGQHFHKFKSELHFENELLFLNHRLVIPSEMQRKISVWLHLPHLGIEKTLARARMLYYWPQMNEQIKELVESCKICEKFKRNNQKEPLVQEEIPKYPFHIIAMDLFEYAGRNHIALIDAYSNYLMAVSVQNKTSKHIIGVICQYFDKLGYPTIIKCDNSPFGSAEFNNFAVECNIQFKFSSPRYAQSNGLAEKGVAIAKNILKRCYEAGDVDKFQHRLLEYNTTPITSMHATPSELFFGRLVKTKLPVSDSLLIKSEMSGAEIQNKLKEKRERQKYYYDRNAKSLPVLADGNLVIFKKSGKEWHYGTIVAIFNDRSYVVRDSFGNHFRRNRRFIAKTKHEDFGASELLFEENVVKGHDNEINNFKEIQIVNPPSNNRNENYVNADNSVSVDLPYSNRNENYVNADNSIRVELPNNDCNVDEPEPVNVVETPVAPDVNETTPDTTGSEAPSTSLPSTEVRTRYGRIVKPPQRYGWDYKTPTRSNRR